MCNLEQFKVDLKALTEEVTPLEWELDDQFFEQLEDAQLQQGSVHVSGSIRKAVGFFELELQSVGTVRVPCDRCLEMMDQPVEADLRLIVKMGSEYTDDDDVITVDEAHPVLDTAWLIYESIALAVPIRHVHQPGDCNVSMSEKLNELSAARSSDADAEDAVDPRWAALKGLKLEK
ncbi:MAG: DUF177 domain-containing protein [Prevotella sp.]|jgi:uncharacterized metal-binding protein YceD (DUF177 family)|nr:DUF177 domain-containing protein [Prevotella sp.]